MKRINFYPTLVSLVFVIGCIWPFVPVLTILFMFFMLIPLGLAIIILIISFLMGLIAADKWLLGVSWKSLLIILVFLASQFFSVFIVDQFFRFTSEWMIEELEEFKIRNKNYPTSFDAIAPFTFGVEYRSFDRNNFELSYSRGYMTREVYASSDKKWESEGWRD